jgi:hypothetical protein
VAETPRSPNHNADVFTPRPRFSLSLASAIPRLIPAASVSADTGQLLPKEGCSRIERSGVARSRTVVPDAGQ